MRPFNIRESLTQSIFSFLQKDGDDIEYRRRIPSEPIGTGVIEKRRPREDEITVFYFPQTWGSTSMGFGGMGGAAMTTAYTTVILMDKKVYVYFGGSFCYAVEDSKEVREMIKNHRMPSIIDESLKQTTVIKTFKS